MARQLSRCSILRVACLCAPSSLRPQTLVAGALFVAAVLASALALLLTSTPAAAILAETGSWPSEGPPGEPVTAPSISPFTPADIDNAPPATARFTYYPPAGASAESPAPAVVLLHGASGVTEGREGRTARAFAAQGVAAMVVDVFGARGGGSFRERLLNITETMAIADAFAAKRVLDARPEVDASRTALIGFSYGGMSSIYAAYQQIADAFGEAPFAAHVAFYGPCIARFEDPTTTGAPVLKLWGQRDAIMNEAACKALADDLTKGGSEVTMITYDAGHRWDARGRRWHAPVHIADCNFVVSPSNDVRDRFTGLAMDSPVTRAGVLALCASREGYLIEPDPAVRAQSDAAMARFLNPVLFPSN